jgi:transcriptional regulator with XRE-family HTH domain
MEKEPGSIQERIVTIRKYYKLNQTEFGRKIGLTHSAISVIELGKIAPTEQNIKHICLAFQINETWLRTGNGAMLSTEVSGEQELIALFRQLSPETRQMILDYALLLIKNEQTLLGKAGNGG